MGKRFSIIAVISLLILSGYSRRNWDHWTDWDGDCQDTRQEILIRDSLIPVFLDKKGCKVILGVWRDPYSGFRYTDPRELDIDHIIPLKYVYDHGGKKWSLYRKAVYANDMRGLVATYKSLNRSKGAKGITEWRPPNESSWCWYTSKWVTIKDMYEITYDVGEWQLLKTMRRMSCGRMTAD